MEFPFSIYFYRHLITIMMGTCKPLYGVKYRNILKYLEKDLKNIIDDYKNVEFEAKDKIPRVLWTLWWQNNEKNIKPINFCYQKNIQLKDFEFYLIHKDNVHNFIDISDVMPMVERGEIKLQFLSDIIRMRLLRNYGGIWADAGLFQLNSNFYERLINDYSFFSLSVSTVKEWMNVSQGKFCASFWATQKNNPFFAYMDDALTTFILKHHKIIDYYQIDFTTMLGYNNIPFIKNLIDTIPPSNPDFYFLSDNINKPFNKGKWERILKDNDILRIPWKTKPKNCTKNGKLTYWGFINGENQNIQ